MLVFVKTNFMLTPKKIPPPNGEAPAPVRAGWGLAVVGVCTLTWWVLRLRGRPTPPRGLRLAGQASLLVTVVLGLVTSLPHILGAAGVR
jgi:hypothetical protein